MHFPAILSQRRTRLSPWVDLVAKEVQFKPETAPELYHCITQRPYVGILARTVDGRIPLVQQFRPCVEEYTWEFPAGTVDDGETPEQAACRELLEEIGYRAVDLMHLGQFHPDTGRLQIQSHAFYCVIPNSPSAPAEPGLSVRLVRHQELRDMILSGEFRHQLHVAIYAAVMVRSIALD